jgi:hypothetical protein
MKSSRPRPVRPAPRPKYLEIPVVFIDVPT